MMAVHINVIIGTLSSVRLGSNVLITSSRNLFTVWDAFWCNLSKWRRNGKWNCWSFVDHFHSVYFNVRNSDITHKRALPAFASGLKPFEIVFKFHESNRWDSSLIIRIKLLHHIDSNSEKFFFCLRFVFFSFSALFSFPFAQCLFAIYCSCAKNFDAWCLMLVVCVCAFFVPALSKNINRKGKSMRNITTKLLSNSSIVSLVCFFSSSSLHSTHIHCL